MPEDLLEQGISIFHNFSVINYALLCSDIYKNTTGNLLIGQRYIMTIGRKLLSINKDWKPLISWWINLAIERNEYEGLVVLLWLYKLRVFLPSEYDVNMLKQLSNRIKKIPSGQKRHFAGFYKAIQKIITQ